MKQFSSIKPLKKLDIGSFVDYWEPKYRQNLMNSPKKNNSLENEHPITSIEKSKTSFKKIKRSKTLDSDLLFNEILETYEIENQKLKAKPDNLDDENNDFQTTATAITPLYKGKTAASSTSNTPYYLRSIGVQKDNKQIPTFTNTARKNELDIINNKKTIKPSKRGKRGRSSRVLKFD